MPVGTVSDGLLSEEDIDVLAALAAGRGLESIARDLRISDRTLRRRLRRVCDALDVRTPIEAVIWAVRTGLI
jgi:DNA-binding NarL/FixJ family response regulator